MLNFNFLKDFILKNFIFLNLEEASNNNVEEVESIISIQNNRREKREFLFRLSEMDMREIIILLACNTSRN